MTRPASASRALASAALVVSASLGVPLAIRTQSGTLFLCALIGVAVLSWLLGPVACPGVPRVVMGLSGAITALLVPVTAVLAWAAAIALDSCLTGGEAWLVWAAWIVGLVAGGAVAFARARLAPWAWPLTVALAASVAFLAEVLIGALGAAHHCTT